MENTEPKKKSKIAPIILTLVIGTVLFYAVKKITYASHHEDTDDAQIENDVAYHQSLSLLTFCVLVLRNGFTVTGESACASPENFDAELGRKIARQNAVQKIWPLMGYALKERLASGAKQ